MELEGTKTESTKEYDDLIDWSGYENFFMIMRQKTTRYKLGGFE